MILTKTRVKQIFSLITVVLFFSTIVEAEVCSWNPAEWEPGTNPECCRMCPRPFYFMWPVDTMSTTLDVLNSSCYTEEPVPGRQGIDLIMIDGDIIKAIWSGTAFRYNEGPLGMDYNCGCGIRFVTNPVPPDGIVYTAFYCHMLAEGRAPGGTELDIGDTIGYAGGGQEDPRCRGDSPGPRLYFELRTNGDSTPVLDRTMGVAVDVFSCFPNTCNYWYDDAGRQCDPKNSPACTIRCNRDRPDCRWPSYAAGPPCYIVTAEGRSVSWYAKVNISNYGQIDALRSNVYDYNAEPTDNRRLLNDFVRIIRIYNTGIVECGRVTGGGVLWNQPCNNIISLYTAPEELTRSLALNGLQRLEYGDETVHNKYIVVSSEYQIIGIDDSNYTDSMYIDLAVVGEEFRPKLDVYYRDYYLARKCDIAGRTTITRKCKDTPIITNRSMTYDEYILTENFTYCEWNLIDAGKFYDLPGVYTKGFEFSRLAATKGSRYYKTVGGATADIERFYPGYTDIMLEWWNNASADRLLGHDGCDPGDVACSLGAATSEYNAFAAEPGTPPFYPEKNPWDPVDCGLRGWDYGYGYWTPNRSDYFGFDDRDDDRADENPKFTDNDGIRDTKYDYESGMPDKEFVNKSVYSIKSNIWAHFITRVAWKGPGYWVHLYDNGPEDDEIDWQVWLMPCKDTAPWTCRTERLELDCRPGRGPAHPRGNRLCMNRYGPDSWCAICPKNNYETTYRESFECTGPGTRTEDCWVCDAMEDPEDPLSECDELCCWGGVKVLDEVVRETVLAYYPEDWPYFMKGNLVEWYQIDEEEFEGEQFPVQPPVCPDDHCAYPLSSPPPAACEYKDTSEPNDNADLG
jgi:hypothetical protein